MNRFAAWAWYVTRAPATPRTANGSFSSQRRRAGGGGPRKKEEEPREDVAPLGRPGHRLRAQRVQAEEERRRDGGDAQRGPGQRRRLREQPERDDVEHGHAQRGDQQARGGGAARGTPPRVGV